MRKVLLILLGLLFIFLCFWFTWFYPQQSVNEKEISAIDVITPLPDVYGNDCLHPFIRYSEHGFAGYHYWMIQSPYYGWNNKVENPILMAYILSLTENLL